ncbi:CPBP family intramembrane glutamic endopeptidase [Eudoraea chungangensis]|uniref:CPBP family intramembrane glutamic endopeptidase n=1 Tax=Eudoraea chungangensis TaxID=1481905 RepID=UPI0023ECD836|nr:CPBP family intramembrane glutamic endopeptidase [Eudoraea chungangensis]
MPSTPNADNKKVYKYFLLTFCISWTLWSPFYFSEEVNEIWVLPGAWGPTIAALLLTFLDKGKEGVRILLRKILIWKLPIKYYLFAIFGILAIGVLSILIYRLIGGYFPDFGLILEGMGLPQGQYLTALLLSPLFFILNTLLGGPIAEELGWRGYAQTHLQKILSPNLSGLSIGLIWAIWHLPLILFLPKAVGNIPVLAYIPLMTTMGVLFSWMYNRTRGSVLLAILMHGGMNFTLGFLGADIFKDQNLLLLFIALIILLALVLATKNKANYEEGKP